MKKFLYSIIFILSCQLTFAQQQYVFTNYLLNEYYYNPALPGSENVHKANIGYRNQWAGFEGAPVTLHANFYGSYANQKKHGYGVSLMSDRSGLIQNTNIYLSYAYHIRLSDSIRMGFGVRPGYLQYNIKLYDTQLADPVDDVLNGNILSTNAIDLGFGLYVYSNKFFISASMRQVLGPAISFTGFNYGLVEHYSAVAGYTFRTKKKKFEFEPSVMMQYVKPAPLQLSAMFKTTYKNKYWAGLTMRTQDAVGIVIGANFWKRLNIGYAFDYSLGQVKTFNNGTHEFMLTFVVTKTKPTLDQEDEDLNNGIFEENNKKKQE